MPEGLFCARWGYHDSATGRRFQSYDTVGNAVRNIVRRWGRPVLSRESIIEQVAEFEHDVVDRLTRGSRDRWGGQVPKVMWPRATVSCVFSGFSRAASNMKP